VCFHGSHMMLRHYIVPRPKTVHEIKLLKVHYETRKYFFFILRALLVNKSNLSVVDLNCGSAPSRLLPSFSQEPFGSCVASAISNVVSPQAFVVLEMSPNDKLNDNE
jgi:hypothetical protein